MIATLILSAALAQGHLIHYEHDYRDVAACESAFSIAKRQMKEVGAKTIRGDCLTESNVEQPTRMHHTSARRHKTILRTRPPGRVPA
jgi:hypothetical protein